ncbi:ribonuclease G [Weissella coleopterorum]|uniref:Ribonuclease G n=1 Tax=Weissella coleopterorum TaxID=2714949 RepID=A0A6G8B202_9LACO|nr:ribonuclease G [Weissella coleopterorum]QIL51262.1 ribonuclease G [Weissella coleopterorum]
MEENSKVTPTEVKGWNWGAFMFNWMWGIGNKSYLPLLVFIPLFNIVWIFIVGAKGNEWAWENGDYKDVATFKAVQATWNRAGLVAFVVAIIGSLLYFMFIGIIMSLVVNSLSTSGY